MEASWLLLFAAFAIAAIFWFRRHTARAADPVVRIPADADKVTAELDANRKWLDAYFALPKEEQEPHREEASRRLLDNSELLLAQDPFGNDQGNDPTVAMIRRTKQLIAGGMTFSEASAKALQERDAELASRSSP